MLSAMGIVGMYFVGKKRWEAFLWLVIMEIMWIVFAIQTKTYGFIVGSLAYIAVYLKNAQSWKKTIQTTF